VTDKKLGMMEGMFTCLKINKNRDFFSFTISPDVLDHKFIE